MLIDEAIITVKSGNGGPGKKAFFPAKGGPSGGDGGDGADVYAVLSHSVRDLRKLAAEPLVKAETGQAGGSNRLKGRKGEDLLVPLPPRTTIILLDTGQEIELNPENPKILLARGGKGGLGNSALKSATNQTPMHTKPAQLG